MTVAGMMTGAISGILLGVSLKWIEAVTNKKVYTLLLNVDFFPWIGDIQWSEQMEFLFHMFIAIVVGVTYSFVVQTFSIRANGSLLLLAAAITAPTVLLYFPLTILAIKETPAINDWLSFSYWTFGHVLFAFCLFITYRWTTNRQNSVK